MALCAYQCENCPVHFTVKIAHQEEMFDHIGINGIIARNVVLDLYENVVESFDSAADDVAVVLNVSGADIALLCSHMTRANEGLAIELF